ncbi:MAG TPA: hypothetical protein VMX36_05435 [Sedimentisphaerales bacterium]|nr:hypothetical protein [Sedimentisphaerales bacterium]
MKQYVLMSILLVSMFVCPAVLSQEFEPEDMEMQMQMRQREMDIKQREAKMDMEREMYNLELEQRRMELERAREENVDDDDNDDDGEGALGFLFLICAIVHILVAIWVYMDIRQLNRGSGIWIIIALLAGLLGALVYAVVRLGDGRQKGS